MASSRSGSVRVASAVGREHGSRRRTPIFSGPDCADLECRTDRLIAELATHPLAEGEARPVAGGVYVSLSQSQPAGLDYALPELGGRMYFFFRKPRDESVCSVEGPTACFRALFARSFSSPKTWG